MEDILISRLRIVNSKSETFLEDVGYNNALIELLKNPQWIVPCSGGSHSYISPVCDGDYSSKRIPPLLQLLLEDVRPTYLWSSRLQLKQVIDYIIAGNKLMAVKTIKDFSGMGLKESKEFADRLIEKWHIDKLREVSIHISF